jgi:uncharacterized protein (TIGR02391 family)
MATKKEFKRKILSMAYNEGISRNAHESKCWQINIQSLARTLEAEKQEAKYRFYEAFHELFIDNLIMKDPYHEGSKQSYALTTKGVKIAESNLDIDEYSYRLENFVINEELLKKCQDLFNGGEYETAVFSAYKLIEVRIREKAGLAPDDIGTKLISQAFKANEGKLRIPTCKTAAEEIGILNLFAGAIMTFKNPTSHRIVDYENPRIALQILVFSELLLNLIQIAENRE